MLKPQTSEMGTGSTLQPFEYAPLKDPNRDIRLVILLPGVYDDDVRLQITHAALQPRARTSTDTGRMTLDDLRRTLPRDWYVDETNEGRYIFVSLAPDGNLRTSWTHPTKHFDPSKYEMYPVADAICDLDFEALSYRVSPPFYR